MSSDQPYEPSIRSVRDGFVWLSAEDNPAAREMAGDDFDRFLARVRRDAAREVGQYIEHLHPDGPTHTTAVLADIDLAADRMGRGIHANGRKRETP